MPLPVRVSFWKEDRSLSVFLGLVVVVYFFLSPVAETSLAISVVLQTCFALCLMSGISAVFGNRPLSTFARLVCLADWVTHQLRLIFPLYALMVADLLTGFFCLGLFVVVLIARVLSGDEGNHFRLQGAIAAFIVTAVAWGHLYALLEIVIPGSFRGPSGTLDPARLVGTLTFFSSITLTTVGYGDITPVHPFARSMVCLEAFWGVLYPAILVSRLVTLSLPQQGARERRVD